MSSAPIRPRVRHWLRSPSRGTIWAEIADPKILGVEGAGRVLAGGVGLLLTQIIKLRGGRVIGCVSREDKVAVAKEAGADHVIVDIARAGSPRRCSV